VQSAIMIDAVEVEVTSRGQLRAWLMAHHNQHDGVWLVRYKKHVGDRYVSYQDVVTELLCFGWIDSRPRLMDNDRTGLWITPRQPKSGWSAVNKVHIAELLGQGLMMPAGQQAIDAAKASGAYELLDAAGTLEVPADLQRALDATPDANQHFAAFPPSTRKATLEWISLAKTAATRQKRIDESASLAGQNRRANQWTKKPS
jgi:uncharacterized protein YdeI (YjbR/CyaY-like superfamily)